MLTRDRELQAALEELHRAEAEYRRSARAEIDRRVTDPELHRHSLQRKLMRVVELRDVVMELRKPPTFDGLIDKLMHIHGLDRDEAEARALQILEDDAA